MTIHVQIFNVDDNCNENNFFDTLTPNDTHVYNMRDIQTNNGAPSGVLLPVNSHGIVVISLINGAGNIFNTPNSPLVGNFRVLDNTGYEYRTNMVGIFNQNVQQVQPNGDNGFYTFNFNQNGNITLSDVVGIAVDRNEEVFTADILDTYITLDVDILNENEVIFSCRNVIFACTDQDNPLLEELLEVSGEASVASFEYGINKAIPHSKGGELLCPGNTISDGFVTLNRFDDNTENFVGFIGLNNGNGRGSMDSFWYGNEDVGMTQIDPPT